MMDEVWLVIWKEGGMKDHSPAVQCRSSACLPACLSACVSATDEVISEPPRLDLIVVLADEDEILERS